jgi:oxygen-independent coproporphyrinogen-3 oxidase
MTAPGFGLYVHWPFCRKKCPYCDFNSHVRDGIDEAAWAAALVAELRHYAGLTPGRRLSSIFFGGGTPSLMSPGTVEQILTAAAGHWGFEPDIEITLEANPTSVESDRFAGFRAAGVNRVSLGVQAFDDESLRFLGRAHSAGEAEAAIAIAAKHFERRSFDLIYARPHQSVDSWLAELAKALTLAAGHLSVYQLTIEAGTAFHTAHARGDFVLPDDDEAGALYEATQAFLGAAGLPAYEISNHARPGEASRHNLCYWRYGDYIGIGPGAHGRLTIDGTKHALRQEKAPETWAARVASDGHATAEDVAISPHERVEEMLMMGLRLEEGVDRARFRAETGIDLWAALDTRGLGDLVEGGFVSLGADRLVATASGRQRLNAVLAKLLA